MNLCGWLKTFKRKGKNAVGANGADEEEANADGGMAPGESEMGERSTSGKRGNGGWGRKIKSVTKLATGERINGQREGTPAKAKEAHSSENDTAEDAVTECGDDEGR
uniref:Uncharacterized protein n=1 Tax=Anopheles maculatus TaxID=74869 RepID=A0A182SBU8_9DIPT